MNFKSRRKENSSESFARSRNLSKCKTFPSTNQIARNMYNHEKLELLRCVAIIKMLKIISPFNAPSFCEDPNRLRLESFRDGHFVYLKKILFFYFQKLRLEAYKCFKKS